MVLYMYKMVFRIYPFYSTNPYTLLAWYLQNVKYCIINILSITYKIFNYQLQP